MDSASPSSSRRRKASWSCVVTGITLVHLTCARWYIGVPCEWYGGVPDLGGSTMTTLPPGPTSPRLVQALVSILTPHRGMRRLRARYGDAFLVKTPIFGQALVI